MFFITFIWRIHFYDRNFITAVCQIFQSQAVFIKCLHRVHITKTKEWKTKQVKAHVWSKLMITDELHLNAEWHSNTWEASFRAVLDKNQDSHNTTYRFFLTLFCIILGLTFSWYHASTTSAGKYTTHNFYTWIWICLLTLKLMMTWRRRNECWMALLPYLFQEWWMTRTAMAAMTSPAEHRSLKTFINHHILSETSKETSASQYNL